jgi:hypothetical protein
MTSKVAPTMDLEYGFLVVRRLFLTVSAAMSCYYYERYDKINITGFFLKGNPSYKQKHSTFPFKKLIETVKKRSPSYVASCT